MIDLFLIFAVGLLGGITLSSIHLMEEARKEARIFKIQALEWSLLWDKTYFEKVNPQDTVASVEE